MKKSTLKMSTKSTRKPYKAPRITKKTIRKSEVPALIYPEVNQVKNNLSQMVAGMTDKKSVEKYTAIAKELSTAARLNNGRVWSWNYVASVHLGKMIPGKRFIQAVNLCVQKSRCKQWFYFTYRRSVAAVYNKTIMAEIIKTNMRNMGYKQVAFSRYMKVKRMATKKHIGRSA